LSTDRSNSLGAEVIVKQIGLLYSSPKFRNSFWLWMAKLLSRPWWLGLGVVLASLITLTIYFLTSGGSSSFANNGNCNAQGSGNTVSCSGPGPGGGR
jgi:hypothetical protein